MPKSSIYHYLDQAIVEAMVIALMEKQENRNMGMTESQAKKIIENLSIERVRQLSEEWACNSHLSTAQLAQLFADGRI